MAAPTNYTELQTALTAELHRSDQTAKNVDFIAYGENLLNRHLRLAEQEATAAVSLSSAAATATLPTDFLEIQDLWYDSDEMQLVLLDPGKFKREGSTSSGRPHYYRIGKSDILFNQAADQAYSLTMAFFERWDIATDTTNWLLTNEPDCYLMAACYAAHRHLRNWERSNMYRSEVMGAIKELNRVSARTRRMTSVAVDEALVGGRRFDINRGY